MTAENTQDLFMHELMDLYYAEKHLANELKKLANGSKSMELKNSFSEHQKETEQHVKRLEMVFDELAIKPKAHKCDGILGLSEEKKSFLKKHPAKEINDIHNILCGIKSERYEISSYEGMIKMATALDLSQAKNLLQENLNEEKNALQKLQVFLGNQHFESFT